MIQETIKCIGKLMTSFFLFSLILLIPNESVQADDTITVDEALAKGNDGTQRTIEGYIVGYVQSDENVTKEDFHSDTNFALAADAAETDVSNMLYVQLPKKFRSDFGLQSNPDMLDESVKVTGNLKEYFRANGLKDTSQVIWSEEDMEHNTAEETQDRHDAEETVQIHDIQGKGHESPLKDQNVKDVEGVVTYKYDIGESNYFHMQSQEDDYDGDPRTSEGIVIYTGKKEDVEIGDLVSISGTVDEYYIDGYDDKAKTDLPVTQINARDDQNGHIDILKRDVELPEPIRLTSSDIPDEVFGKNSFEQLDPGKFAIDFWESMEAMRVKVTASKAVAPQEEESLTVVTNEFDTETDNGGVRLTEEGPNKQLIHFQLHPTENARNFAVKTGDKFNSSITGVVNYGFSNYKVYADLDNVEDVFREGNTEPETTDIVEDEDKLTVASYNVENFSANDNAGETPDEKAENIARAFVKDMEAPDIIGVIEMQDNNGQEQGPDDADASESYKRLINEIEQANGPEYDYVNIDPNYNEDGGAPDSNIQVGFLYNPKRVSLTDGEKGSADEAVVYENGSLTLNPGRVDPRADAFEGIRKPLAAQFEFNGESVVVVANHLNAKLGDDPLFGQNQPPESGSEYRRVEMAEILNGFVQAIQADNPDENIVVLGDMNDVEDSSVMNTIKGEELTNLIEKVPEEKRYSFVHQGNSQVIDHMLVSNHLADTAVMDMLHVNADFTEMHGRASDHDPVLAQLDLTGGESASEKESSILANRYLILLIGVVFVIVCGALLLIRKRSVPPQ